MDASPSAWRVAECDGMLVSQVSAIEHYLETMRQQVAELQHGGQVDRLTKRFGRDQSRGFDQGIHNVLVRRAQAGPDSRNMSIHTLQLIEGPVLHGNGVRAKRHFTFDGAALHTQAGPVFAVSHQYGSTPIAPHLSCDGKQKAAGLIALRGHASDDMCVHACAARRNAPAPLAA